MVEGGKTGLQARNYLKKVGDYRVGLKKPAKNEGLEFLDIGTVGQTCIAHSGKPYEFFLRDPVHCNHRGRRVLARIIERYLEPPRQWVFTTEGTEAAQEEMKDSPQCLPPSRTSAKAGQAASPW